MGVMSPSTLRSVILYIPPPFPPLLLISLDGKNLFVILMLLYGYTTGLEHVFFRMAGESQHWEKRGDRLKG